MSGVPKTRMGSTSLEGLLGLRKAAPPMLSICWTERVQTQVGKRERCLGCSPVQPPRGEFNSPRNSGRNGVKYGQAGKPTGDSVSRVVLPCAAGVGHGQEAVRWGFLLSHAMTFPGTKANNELSRISPFLQPPYPVNYQELLPFPVASCSVYGVKEERRWVPTCEDNMIANATQEGQLLMTKSFDLYVFREVPHSLVRLTGS